MFFHNSQTAGLCDCTKYSTSNTLKTTENRWSPLFGFVMLFPVFTKTFATNSGLQSSVPALINV